MSEYVRFIWLNHKWPCRKISRYVDERCIVPLLLVVPLVVAATTMNALLSRYCRSRYCWCFHGHGPGRETCDKSPPTDFRTPLTSPQQAFPSSYRLREAKKMEVRIWKGRQKHVHFVHWLQTASLFNNMDCTHLLPICLSTSIVDHLALLHERMKP